MASITKPTPVLSEFAPMGARRMYVLGGIALIATGMLFGDIFAIFVLHQNADRQGGALMEAARAVATGNTASSKEIFARLGALLEDRGTKVDAHVHVIGAGYLALILNSVQPYIGLSQAAKKRLAVVLIFAGTLLPIGIFLIHYIGLTYSPFAVIGWASMLADSAGALLILVLVLHAWGFSKYLASRQLSEPELPKENSMPTRALLTGGTLLILLGFLHGAYYAGALLYAHEQMETDILGRILTAAAQADLAGANAEVSNFGRLAGTRAVHIGAHSHIIELGLLAILLSFVQPYVFLAAKWKRRWVKVLLGGSTVLPVFVLLEVKLGLIAAGIADVGGLAVIVALVGMMVGIIRHTGRLDQTEGAA
jgi:hypothetical protein